MESRSDRAIKNDWRRRKGVCKEKGLQDINTLRQKLDVRREEERKRGSSHGLQEGCPCAWAGQKQQSGYREQTPYLLAGLSNYSLHEAERKTPLSRPLRNNEEVEHATGNTYIGAWCICNANVILSTVEWGRYIDTNQFRYPGSLGG